MPVHEKKCVLICVVFLAVFLASACAATISPQILSQVERKATLPMLTLNPDPYIGKMVMFSGIIIDAGRGDEGVVLTVLERPAGSGGRPLNVPASGGRFLAEVPSELATQPFTPGQSVTAAGIFQGQKVPPYGDGRRPVPVIRVKDIHLWGAGPLDNVNFSFSFQTQL